MRIPIIFNDGSEFISQTKEDVEKLMDELNPKTLEQLPKEVQSNIQETLERFQGGFMQSPSSSHYFLKSSSLTMIFKESQIVVQIPQYDQKDTVRKGFVEMETSKIIGKTEVVLHFPGSNLANPMTTDPLSSRYNYFKGDESQWIRNSPYYQKLVYKNLYENIDLVYDLSYGELKYEFLVHPGGDYHEIELEWLGDVKMSQLEQGLEFSFNMPNGVFPITDNNPINFIGKERSEEIYGEFTLVDENSYGFWINDYDSSKELIIDPKVELGFSTLLGGSAGDRGYGIALDSSNNIYISGYTGDSTTDFPTTPGVYNETHNGGSYDVFVTKLSSDGSTLLFSTLIGGSGREYNFAMALDVFRMDFK